MSSDVTYYIDRNQPVFQSYAKQTVRWQVDPVRYTIYRRHRLYCDMALVELLSEEIVWIKNWTRCDSIPQSARTFQVPFYYTLHDALLEYNLMGMG